MWGITDLPRSPFQAGLSKKGERETVTVKIGDRVGEYKLNKISPDRIGLEAQEDSFEVLLYDAGAPKKRVYAKIENKSATATSTASGPSAPVPEAAKPTPSPGTPPPEEAARPILLPAGEVPKPIPLPPVAAPIPLPSSDTVAPSSSSPGPSPYASERRKQLMQRTPPSGRPRYPEPTPPVEE